MANKHLKIPLHIFFTISDKNVCHKEAIEMPFIMITFKIQLHACCEEALVDIDVL